MNEKIFISYSRKDISKAKKIKEEIEKITSASCWMDLDGIESGSQFEDVIISAIDNARLVIFLLSENSMQSKWTKDEVRYAYEIRKKIIPVNIDNCTPSGWFLFKFSGYDVIDYSKSYQKQKFFDDISEWIGDSEKPEQTIVAKKAKKHNSLSIYRIYAICQYTVFGAILIAVSSMFFFGLLTMKEGNVAMRYNILLCTCLCGTLYFTYLLFTKKKKKAFYIIALLDIVEIILLCSIAWRIAGYSLTTGYHYNSFLYKLMNGLGIVMKNRGDLLVNILMEFFAVLHIATLFIVIKAKIKGESLWNRLS